MEKQICMLVSLILLVCLNGPTDSLALAAAPPHPKSVRPADSPTFPGATATHEIDFSKSVSGVAIAPDGRLYVASWRENRIYSWPNAASAANPASTADLVFGTNTALSDPNSNKSCGQPSATTLCGPESIAVDQNNNLYVADSYNNRVLIFLNPDTDATPLVADLVLGQGSSTNFTANANSADTPAPEASYAGLYFPRGLALDTSNNLYVVDEFNHRVLKFPQPASGTTTPALVIGQATLTDVIGQESSGQAATNRFDLPLGVALDGSGNVFVADHNNHRVLRFDAPTANSPDGTLVYSGSTSEYPTDVTFDSQGNLFVSFADNDLIYAFTPGSTTPAAAATFQGLDGPLGMAFDAGGNLYVANCVNPYPCDKAGKLLRFDAPPSTSGTISIDTTAAGTAFTPARMLGTNAEVWLHADGLSDPTLIARTKALGSGLMRIPGGSHSENYGALSCEVSSNVPGAAPCTDSSDAHLSDLITFLQATGRSAIYTVNVNTTAQEAAAVVAFLNAGVNDATTIGTDKNGTDWKTSGYWAQLRAQYGHADPIGIKLWDFGNEPYGGMPSTGGSKCQSYGWETIWTCDATEYINGARGHDGYRQFRAAMLAVDPTIQLGAVGYPDPAGYTNWTNDLLTAGGDVIDFLEIHAYPYDTFPADTASGQAQMLALPETQWSGTMSALRSAIQSHASGRAIPIWATEYNMGSPDNDTTHQLAHAINGLYLADSIGQMISQGYSGAMQWDLDGFVQANGTNMGLLNHDASLARQPSYYVYPLWSHAGSTLLPAVSSFDPSTQLSVYAGQADASTITLLAINKTGQALSATLTVHGKSGAIAVSSGTADVVQASSLDATTVTYNGTATPADDLSNAPAQPLSSVGTAATYQFAPYSVTLLRLSIPAQPGTTPGKPAVYLPLIDG